MGQNNTRQNRCHIRKGLEQKKKPFESEEMFIRHFDWSLRTRVLEATVDSRL